MTQLKAAKVSDHWKSHVNNVNYILYTCRTRQLRKGFLSNLIGNQAISVKNGQKPDTPTQMTGMIRQKWKPQRIPGPKCNTQKIPRWNFQAIKLYLRNYTTRIHGNYHKSSESLLKSSYPPKILGSSLSLEIWRSPPPPPSPCPTVGSPTPLLLWTFEPFHK